MKPYVLKGKIVHGKGLGRTVGMPTANLQVCDETILPENGVYATRIEVNSQIYNSVTNVGRRPSVDAKDNITVETYILDFGEDIYGQDVVLEFHKFLRPIHKFENLEAVQKQVQKDIVEVRNYFK